MKKILIIHNSHRKGSSSGDDIVFKKEAELLTTHAHDVIRFNLFNDEFDASNAIKKLLIGLQIPWSISAFRMIEKVLSKECPDIVHIHNFFPLLSPSIYYAIHSKGIPIVQTLHDFRFLCPMAFFMRNGFICEECKGGSFLRSIKYGCFKNSKVQTIPVALMLKIHYMLNTFKNKIDAYICLTESQRKIFLDAGFDRNKLFLKPNLIDDTFTAGENKKGNYVIFIGRIGVEKGLGTIIEAWKYLPDVPLKIIGDGPDAEKFNSLALNLNIKNIDFLGYRPHNECMKILNKARFLVMPSICYETFGLTIVEAFSYFKPVIVSNMGAMADIVKDKITGLLFTPKNAKELANKITWLWNNSEECMKMGQNARTEYEAKYTPEKNYEMLMGIYQKTIDKKKNEYSYQKSCKT